jgi:hypothetical protein
LDIKYWWPNLYKNAYKYYQTRDGCQKHSNLITTNMAKLVITLPEKSFIKWCLDFIGFIKPTRRYIGKT